ncbi:MAG: carboxymethylenebutenolidase [Solirubrobacteraceae bacterium]|jgi:carboxymethylenebutenolidase|nr:carboxymethylenebutenolidase [Solirubrobacteraceae bacterium]
MAPLTRTEHVQVDGGEMSAHAALPPSGTGPGIVVLHEIFGVNEYVQDACRRLAELGYCALAPDLFWRTEPGLSLRHDEDGLSHGMAAAQRLDFATAVFDAIAALGALRALPEVSADGRAGVLGFCLGGTFAYQVAVQEEPDAAVCYYGSGIPDALHSAGAIACPTLLQFGGADPFIPREQVDRVAAMAAGREEIECHVHEGAGHAFDNHFAPMFHDPEAAAHAWELTRGFLARALPLRRRQAAD